jgi:nucleoid-associated protein YgaU
MPRLRFLATAADYRPGKETTVYGAGHETDYDVDDYDFVKEMLLDGKVELLDGVPDDFYAQPESPPA